MLLKQNRAKIILLYVICFMLFVIVTSVQWLPTWQFISLSARDFDQGSWLKQGWFIPWQNLIQFLVPDFFGNPATGNYWGVWNYGEFIGFIGIIPLIFALYGLVFNISKKTLFFGFFLFFSLIFALPTWFAQFPFIWQIPLISSSQPTRLIFVADFSLCILAALGFDHFNKDKNWKKITLVLLLLGLLFLLIWILVAIPTTFKLSITNENLAISKRNLILPTLLFTLGSMFIFLSASAKRKVFKLFYVLCFMLLVIFDLFRFGWKFTPFSKTAWVYPATKLTNILKKEGENYRIMSLDRRIMPPNFSTHYHIADIAGYDPLYLRWYGQLIAAWDRNKPDITPASFNRIITPMQFDNFIADLLGVKYFLSLEPINSTKLNLVESEGKTYLYENEHVSPRAFLVENVIEVKNPQEEIEKMFRLGDQLDRIAVTSGNINLTPFPYQSGESVKIITYSDNYIRLSAKTGVDRLLVLTDIYYPSWQVYLDGGKTALHRVDFALRGVIIPAGEHQVEFKANLL